MRRYLSHVMNVAMPTKDCLELVNELLEPIMKAKSERSLTRQEVCLSIYIQNKSHHSGKNLLKMRVVYSYLAHRKISLGLYGVTLYGFVQLVIEKLDLYIMYIDYLGKYSLV